MRAIRKSYERRVGREEVNRQISLIECLDAYISSFDPRNRIKQSLSLSLRNKRHFEHGLDFTASPQLERELVTRWSPFDNI